MSARLPIPGNDNNVWGDILNTFLEVSHNTDGTLQPSAIASAGGYIIPSNGIPTSDLAPSIQTNLALVETAVQLSGDLSGTATDVIVSSTHLTNALPVSQGGTGSTTQNFVDVSSDQTINGVKTFNDTISGNISGNAATVTTNADLSGDVVSVGNATTLTGSSNVASIISSNSVVAAKAPLGSPSFTGIPTAPTAAAGTNTTQIATTAFVETAVTNSTASGYDQLVMQATPAAWWKLADAGGSTTAADSSGDGWTGTPANITFGETPGPIGAAQADTAALFNGSNGAITTSYNPGSLAGFSVEAWVNANGDTVTGSRTILANDSPSTSNNGFNLEFSLIGGEWYPLLYIGNGTTNSHARSNSTAVPSTGWIHIVGTYSASTITMYVNGQNVGTGSLTGPMSVGASSSAIGTKPGGANYFLGLMAEIAFYTYALTPAQILAHYNAGTAGENDIAVANPAAGQVLTYNTVSGKFQNENSIFVNVMDYGATGNGMTDDTAAIQAAIAAVPYTANNLSEYILGVGGTLYFPVGTYLVASGPLIVNRPIRMMGAGGNAVLKTTNSAIIDFGGVTGGSPQLVEGVIEIDHLGFNATGGHVFQNACIHGELHLHHLNILQNSTGYGVFWMDDTANGISNTQSTGLYQGIFSHITYILGPGTRSVEAFRIVVNDKDDVTDLTFEKITGPQPTGYTNLDASADNTRYQIYLACTSTTAGNHSSNIKLRDCLFSDQFGGVLKTAAVLDVTVENVAIYNTFDGVITNPLFYFTESSTSSTPSEGIVLRNCIRTDALGNTGTYGPPYDVYLDSSCKNVLIENYVIALDLGGGGPYININGASQVIVIQNATGTHTPQITGAAADTIIIGQGQMSATALAAGGLTGATSGSRYAGATASGAPVTGTSATGDFVIDHTGNVWICTSAGTPGSWTVVGGEFLSNPMSNIGDTIYGGSAGGPMRLPGNTGTQKQFLSETGTGSASAAPAWAAVPGQFLATPVQYAPSAVSTYSLSTSGFTALDTTNLVVTFIAPASGEVLVTLSGWVVEGSTGSNIWFGLINASGGTLIGPTSEALNGGFANKGILACTRHVLTGLTAGQSYILQWAACGSVSGSSLSAGNNGGSTTSIPSVAASAPATMTVQAAV